MAKQQKKPAKRVFFVRRNIDDISAFRNTTTDPQKLLDFYEGEFFGSAGAEEDVCSGRSRAFVRGWDTGSAAYREAVESFERAREAGRKSAEAREARSGTAQPTGGKGHGTKNRTQNGTKDRTPFVGSEQGSEHPSDNGERGDVDSMEYSNRGSGWGHRSERTTEHPSDPSEQESEPSDTHHPAARSHDGPLKMTSGVNARARTNDEQQNKNDEQPRYRTVLYPSGPVRERIYA